MVTLGLPTWCLKQFTGSVLFEYYHWKFVTMDALVLQVDEIPEEFPFEIQDNPGERTISLYRKYKDETIKVEVDIPNVSAEDEEEDNAGENDEQTREESSIPLVVSISKDSGECLEFGVTAFPDEISIDHLSIKKPDGSEDQLAYEGPEFQLVYLAFDPCSFYSLEKICSLNKNFLLTPLQ